MSDESDCDLSCNPANSRRPPVSGLEGVKYVTEDSTRVDTQAPVSVNATGQSKKYMQQAFHPSLFTRSRSFSTGSPKSSTNKEKKTPEVSLEVKKSTGLPDWQKVPVNLKKKRKLRDSQSPEITPTSNMFDGLPLTQETENPKEKKPSKPPPIILYGIGDLNKLTDFLETATKKETFKYRIVNKTQIRIMCEDVEAYKKLITAVREKGLIGHTFNRKEDRNCRLVIKNLHHTTPHQAIKSAFEETGNTVLGEIINARYGPDKKPTSTFFVNLQPGPQNKAAKEVRCIYHQIVTIEEPKKRNTIVQCQRCQQYGHTKNYCMRPPRCLKCAESHITKHCPKVDRSTPATCALCFGPHPSNYKGCEVYKEILTRKTSKRTVPRRTEPQSQPLKNLNAREKEENDVITNNINITKRYSEALKDPIKTYNLRPSQETDQHPTYDRIEQIFIKQSEKIDIILQQMSTMLGLLTTLVNKLSSK